MSLPAGCTVHVIARDPVRFGVVARVENLAAGRREGYPECCVQWFTFVWAPVCEYLMFSGHGDRASLDAASAMLRGSCDRGYVQCPRCREEDRRGEQ